MAVETAPEGRKPPADRLRGRFGPYTWGDARPPGQPGATSVANSHQAFGDRAI